MKLFTNQSINQSIKVFLEWPKVALPLQGPLQVQMSVTKARKRLTE